MNSSLSFPSFTINEEKEMKRDVFEEKNMRKAVLAVGLPSMLAQLATLIYNLADTYFVSLTRDSAQIAAVTLCTPVLLFIMSIASIFGMGGSSVIARLIGEGERKESARCLNFCTYSMATSGILIFAIGLFFTNEIASLIGADQTTMVYTVDYLKWIFIGAPFIMMANGFAHIFRSVGFVKEATVSIVLGNVVNIILDWLFIVVFGWGTMGAALATSIGFMCGSLYSLIYLLIESHRKNDLIDISPKGYRIERIMAGNVIRIGIPGSLITVLLSISNIVLNNFISLYSPEAVAAYGIAYKIDMFPILLSVGLTMGTCPLLGFHYGRKDKENLKSVVRWGTIFAVGLGVIFTVALMTMSTIFASIFSNDETLISRTSWFIRLLCIHAPIIGVINMVTAYFQALGKALLSLVVTVLRNAVLFIPMLFVMNALLGLNGVILNQAVVEAIMTVVCIVLYSKATPEKLLK